MGKYAKEKARQKLMQHVWELAEQLGPIPMWDVIRSVQEEYERDIEEFARMTEEKSRANVA